MAHESLLHRIRSLTGSSTSSFVGNALVALSTHGGDQALLGREVLRQFRERGLSRRVVSNFAVWFDDEDAWEADDLLLPSDVCLRIKRNLVPSAKAIPKGAQVVYRFWLPA